MKSIISYNVNGIRSAANKGFWNWINQENPDIICLQEIKAQLADLDITFTSPASYHAFYHSAEKKGYSGVGILTKEKPLAVTYGCGIPQYDREGRFIRADFEGFSVMSVYMPSGTSGEERQGIKEQCMADLLPYFISLKEKFPYLILCGDFNIAHQEIDIHDPVRNKNNTGFLPHERAWMTTFFESGFMDSFRFLNPSLQQYSWWTFRANARANNKGWRIDYQIVSDNCKPLCKDSSILTEIVHSDHCPLRLVIDI